MNSLLARTYDQTVQRLRGWDYLSALQELEKLQWASSDEVRAYRLQKLLSLMEHCYEHVPFYRDHFKKLGITSSDIKREEDLRALPILDKQILRNDYQRFFATDKKRPFDIWASSGSTGEPFSFRLSRTSICFNTFAALARGKRWWSFEIGDPEGMIWSGVRDVSGTISGKLNAMKRRISWRLKNIQLVDIYDMDLAAIRAAFELFLRFRPRFLRCIASGLYRFCAGLEELGLDGHELGLEGLIYTGESLSRSQRDFIESSLGCKTISEYGCTELGIIAFECPAGGLHLSHDNFVLEFLTEGRIAKPGEPASLVVTNLSDFATPLVRYMVGDIVVPSDSSCACGRTLPLISEVCGRSHDTISTPDGRVVNGLYFTHLFDQLPAVHQFCVVQENLLQLRVELCSSDPIPQSVLDSVRAGVREVMGEEVELEVMQVSQLPVSESGKTPWIISNLDV